MSPPPPTSPAPPTLPPNLPPPKAILFDIGGVTCLSPFTAIATYETTHNIPLGWINYAISRSTSTPDSAWGRLERGEQRPGADWFRDWREDLRCQGWWEEFWGRRGRRSGARGVRRKEGRGGEEEAAPVVAVSAAGADADVRPSAPQSDAANSSTNHSSTRRTTIPPLSTITAAGADAEVPASAAQSAQSDLASSTTPPPPTHQTQPTIPPPPDIDTELLFTSMMSAGRTPDPYIFPAILALRRTNRFIIGALSNTSLSSSSEPLDTPPPRSSLASADPTTDVRAAFDLFISSAHVGMRKPEARIYEYAMAEVRRVWRESGREAEEGELNARDILFLDDIGANLRAAREMGWRTFKVGLGAGREAVGELEAVTGVMLVGEKGRL